MSNFRARIHIPKDFFATTTGDSQEQLEEMLAAHDREIARHPENAAAHAYRCYCLMKLLRFDEAREACHKAIELEHHTPALYQVRQFLSEQEQASE